MKRILVIEDEPAIRHAVVDILESGNFQIVEAENGLVGVRAAREHLPDLIICDIMMPRLDGYGVLEELSQDPATATIPLIFLTARADRAALRRGMDLGADDYLTKPFSHDELLQAVDTRLAKQARVMSKFEKKLDDLRDNIALSLPHELRTPLAGILTSAIVLKDDLESLDRADMYQIAKIIYASSQRLNRLIMNYLTYAELEITATDTEAVRGLRDNHAFSSTAYIADIANRAAQQAKRETDLELDIQTPAVRMTDMHLTKMLEELLDNALKYSRAGTPVRVTIQSSGSVATLTVIDRGRGMTTQQIADVGAYVQFERKLHEQQGSGLGLAIAKRLAELYGGELTIESVPGEQTTVRVTLPA